MRTVWSWRQVAVAVLTVCLSMMVFQSCASSNGRITGTTVSVLVHFEVVSPVEAEVTAQSIDDPTQTFTATTNNSGAFSLSLPPGDYEVSGVEISPDPGGQATPLQVTVTGGRTTKIKLEFVAP